MSIEQEVDDWLAGAKVHLQRVGSYIAVDGAPFGVTGLVVLKQTVIGTFSSPETAAAFVQRANQIG